MVNTISGSDDWPLRSIVSGIHELSKSWDHESPNVGLNSSKGFFFFILSSVEDKNNNKKKEKYTHVKEDYIKLVINYILLSESRTHKFRLCLATKSLGKGISLSTKFLKAHVW